MVSYSDDGDDFLQHIVAGYKAWCHHFQPERKTVKHVIETSQLTTGQKISSKPES